MNDRVRFARCWLATICGMVVLSGCATQPANVAKSQTPWRHTTVSVVGDEFYINGRPTYEGRYWQGHKVQGLLLNSRMVQGIFDDRNKETVTQWAYPDTGQWDAERN